MRAVQGASHGEAGLHIPHVGADAPAVFLSGDRLGHASPSVGPIHIGDEHDDGDGDGDDTAGLAMLRSRIREALGGLGVTSESGVTSAGSARAGSHAGVTTRQVPAQERRHGSKQGNRLVEGDQRYPENEHSRTRHTTVTRHTTEDALREALEGDMKASLGVFLLDADRVTSDVGGVTSGGGVSTGPGNASQISSVPGPRVSLRMQLLGVARARGLARAAAGALRGHLSAISDQVVGEHWGARVDGVGGVTSGGSGVTSAVDAGEAAAFRVALGAHRVLARIHGMLTSDLGDGVTSGEASKTDGVTSAHGGRDSKTGGA